MMRILTRKARDDTIVLSNRTLVGGDHGASASLLPWGRVPSHMKSIEDYLKHSLSPARNDRGSYEKDYFPVDQNITNFSKFVWHSILQRQHLHGYKYKASLHQISLV